jgi:hypothetical protein
MLHTVLGVFTMPRTTWACMKKEDIHPLQYNKIIHCVQHNQVET